MNLHALLERIPRGPVRLGGSLWRWEVQAVVSAAEE